MTNPTHPQAQVAVTQAEIDSHALFLRAARDFYDSGRDNFTPDYDCYGDLLVAAEAMSSARQTSTATLEADNARLREALERIAAFRPSPATGDWADKVDGQGFNRAGNYASSIARLALAHQETTDAY